ncbi:MAG: hypothetical protein AAF340_06450 [Pseudomonadota bacterium]
MYDDDKQQREALENTTIDFTVKVPVRDLIDLVANEAMGGSTCRSFGQMDVWSYLGPAAALTAVKDHGWMFADHLGPAWVEAALLQWDSEKFEKPIERDLHEAQKLVAKRYTRENTRVPA